jgi:hypothetical protein
MGGLLDACVRAMKMMEEDEVEMRKGVFRMKIYR